ncbi:MAG: NADH-quinone oxidoreductase subunit NuoG [Desulfobacterales bacterium]
MVTIYIDGRSYQVKDGQNLLQACLGLGFDLPYFCWHPALGSVGACRQCAVKQFKDEKDTDGQIVMACMTPADDGTRISIDDPEARAFRSSVIEWLMVNHPHDCPVCDEGGECHLQDMTVMTGHTYREYRFKKRTHRNQQLGPFINHEMNRCIQCYRCVRFYRDYAGGRDLDVFGSHDHVYFGRHRDGVLKSEFSGNLVEICPTGVFTDKTLKKHYNRKWDLQTAPSICVHCGLGCNTLPGERYGQLRRIRNRYHHEVNGYFLCDRGRYGYAFVNSPRRIRRPLGRSSRSDKHQTLTRDAALRRAAELLGNGRRLIGIGSPRASLESNFALRSLVGPQNFYAGISDRDFELHNLVKDVLQRGPARSPSLNETMVADAVFVLGEDVTNTAPLLALNLRQLQYRKAARIASNMRIPQWSAAGVREVGQNERAALYIATPRKTKLDDAAAGTHRATPDGLARLGLAVASALDPAAPAVTDMTDAELSMAREIARVLREADRPLVVCGASNGSRVLIQAAANVAAALCTGGRSGEIFLTLPECNSLGLALMGSAGGLETAFEALKEGRANTLVVVENDLFRRIDFDAATALLDAAEHVVAIDHLDHATTRRADLVLPAATFAEGSGTLVNNEGRAQRFYAVFEPPPDVQASWRWLQDLMTPAGRSEVAHRQILDDVVAAVSAAIPALKELIAVAPPAGFRTTGGRIPRQSHRFSGRTAMHADISVHEPKPPQDVDTPLAFSMEGHDSPPPPPPSLIPRFWAPGWNSVQSLNKFQSDIGGTLRGGDPGRRLIEPQAAGPPTYFPDIPPRGEPRKNGWQFVALHHIFGSEELSLLSSGVAELVPQPYLALRPEDAARLGVTEDDPVTVTIDDVTLQLAVKLDPGLPENTAGLPSGLPRMPVLSLPAFGTIEKGIEDE